METESYRPYPNNKATQWCCNLITKKLVMDLLRIWLIHAIAFWWTYSGSIPEIVRTDNLHIILCDVYLWRQPLPNGLWVLFLIYDVDPAKLMYSLDNFDYANEQLDLWAITWSKKSKKLCQ